MLGLISVLPVSGIAQVIYSNETVKVNNFTTFNAPVKEVYAGWSALTPDSLKSHPEYGELPYNAPCTDCVELLAERTANTRRFIQDRGESNRFLSTSSYLDLHYKDASGRWISYDPRLMPTDLAGVYQSRRQPNTTVFNAIEGFSSIQMIDGTTFKFNHQMRAYYENALGAPVMPENINRSVYTVGDDGVEIKNAFTGIDQQLIYGRSKIKSDYIIHHAESISPIYNRFVIEDVFTVPDGYVLVPDIYEGVQTPSGWWYGELILENASGLEMGRMGRPILHDSDTSGTADIYSQPEIIGYAVNQVGNVVTLKLIVNASWLRAPDRVFPIHIDPTVFGTTATWTGTNGADDSPNWCLITLAVPTPANATLTGSSCYLEFAATGANCPPSCRLNDLQLRVYTACDYSPTPAGVWVCPGAPCNTAGVWMPTIDDATTADLVTCYTPQCASFNIDFTLQYNQFNCVTPGACVTTCAFVQEFAVTIEGETVTATGLAEGAAAYLVVDCTDQSGWLSASTPNYGVPPYTYVWTPGGYTFSPVYVTFPLGVTNYTLTMTDACGQVVTDVVTVTNNCLVLPIDILSFTGVHANGVNVLQWNTAPETPNKTYYVERSMNGRDFTPIGKIDATGTIQTQFTFTDDQVNFPVLYYRLMQQDDDSTIKHSDVIALQADIQTDAMVINQYNPETGDAQLSIFTQHAGAASLTLVDVQGKTIARYPLNLQAGGNMVQIDLPELASGTYILTANGEQLQASARLIR